MNFRKNQPCLDLNGAWSFAWSDSGPAETPFRTAVDLEQAVLAVYPATVPGNFELDLQTNGCIDEPFFGMNIAALTRYERCHVWYFRRFESPQTPPQGTQAYLVLEGVDCYADIYLNGECIAVCDNMLIEQVIPVQEWLRNGPNELFIHIRPAAEAARGYDYPPALFAQSNRYESLYVRKAPHMYGWDIMPRALSAGLWRPVTLRFLPVERLDYVYLETQEVARDKSRAALALHYQARTNGSDGGGRYEIQIEGRCGDSVFSKRAPLLFEAGMLRLNVPEPRLWWPRGRGDAALYDVAVQLLRNGELIDSLTFTHGIRTVELERTSVTDEEGTGAFCFRVNHERVFVLGTNWVPADAYHSRDRERIPPMIDLAEEIGCNMIRCWGGNVYEDDRFYELCDEKGILVWQDFAMACAVYPQDRDFRYQIAHEARQVVRRLRQHACVALWAGDNECDQAYSWGGRRRDPNTNVLTREVLPVVLRDEDPSRPYLPSSPYIDTQAYAAGERYLPENHLWGPRDYYKSAYYTGALCHFASEIGYHGCPSPESLAKFLSPDKLWPYTDNDEWRLHATSPIPGVDLYDYRIELMAKQVRVLFGDVPDNLEDFAFASQVSQAEAMKFFIEMFRCAKWRRTGIIWWNLMDGWPQFSDAVVDYYFGKKLAYDYIRRAQSPLCLMLREPEGQEQQIVVANDTRQDLSLEFRVTDADSGEVLAQGTEQASADAVTVLGRLAYPEEKQRFLVLQWTGELGPGLNHYLSGTGPFPLAQYRQWRRKLGAAGPESL